MGIKTYEEMNELEIDILKEIGSIGGGNAPNSPIQYAECEGEHVPSQSGDSGF